MDPRQSYQMDGHLQDYASISCRKTIFSYLTHLKYRREMARHALSAGRNQDYETNQKQRNIHTVTQVIDDVFNHHLGFSIRAVGLHASSFWNGNDWGCSIDRC